MPLAYLSGHSAKTDPTYEAYPAYSMYSADVMKAARPFIGMIFRFGA